MKYTRLNPSVRKGEILAAAVRLSEVGGYHSLTRKQLAKAAGTSPPLITRYFSNMDKLREAIMEEAVRLRVHRVIAQGLINRCPVAEAAPSHVRIAAMASIPY